MKGQVRKKALAGCLALMIVSGGLPVQQIADLSVDTAITASAESVASGECGENLTWSLSDDGILTITGTGDMYDYNNSDGGDSYGMINVRR